MKSICSFAFVVASSVCCLAQQSGAPLPQPAPPMGPQPETMDGAVTKKEASNWNEMIVQARTATKDKRYGDSEALMLQATRENPNLILPWVELGLAQIGLKKYDDAENCFKIALGIDPASLQRAHSDDFYLPGNAAGVVAPMATRASRNTNGGIVDSGDKRTPDIMGTSYASLGEIYIRQGKVTEGENAFDMAVKANPVEAALYRRNEMIFFFQTGRSDEQLKAADEAIAVDPTRAMLYYFKGQALVGKATVDPKTQKIVLPPGCGEAYQKYLALEPTGQFSPDARSVLAAVGVPATGGKK